MELVIKAVNLPGLRFAEHENVHVGLQVGEMPLGPVPGDAPSADWETDLQLINDDVRGPAVHGPRGARFVYLTWGDPRGDDWRMFRRAKLMLAPAIAAMEAGATSLTVTVDLSDEHGGPRAARFPPSALDWRGAEPFG